MKIKNFDKMLSVLAGIIMGAIFIVFVACLFAYPCKWLWNYVMPYLFHLPEIHAGQALALMALGSMFTGANKSSTSKESK